MKIGELLVARAKLDAAGLDRALRLQQESGERIGALLVQLGLVAEREVARALGEQLGIPVAAPEDYPEVPVLANEVEPEFLERVRAVPLRIEGEEITVALADPLDRFTIEAFELATGRRIKPRIGAISDIETALRRHYAEGVSSMSNIVAEFGDGEAGGEPDDAQHLRDLASEAPIIRLVNLMISRALEARASDIHIEPFAGSLKIRYRIDGVLQNVEAPPVRSAAAVISRVKVMASLNIAERRLPQDGRIRLRVEGRDIDMRISTVPTMHGESVVMRILDKGSVPLDFVQLGFDPEVLASFEALLNRPRGIILVTGPTGSGKTTTLYTALARLNTAERKILTVEDPVEYRLDGINQIQIKPTIGLTFASALRSILRQDPEVIMVGEMRDLETARIAVQSALTGHKVFSTLHTNDAAGSVTRLLDMGVEDYLLTSTVDCVLAQRLVRVLCPECREAYRPAADVFQALEENGVTAGDELPLYHARGCPACHTTGYRGRTTILELLPMHARIRDAILAHQDADTLARTARELGMRSMYQDGLRKAVAGITTFEEVARVTQEA